MTRKRSQAKPQPAPSPVQAEAPAVERTGLKDRHGKPLRDRRTRFND